MAGLYKFIGTNGSLGLTKGCLYFVHIRRKLSGYIVAQIEGTVVIDGKIEYSRGKPIICEYSNINKFYENWKICNIW